MTFLEHCSQCLAQSQHSVNSIHDDDDDDDDNDNYMLIILLLYSYHVKTISIK